MAKLKFLGKYVKWAHVVIAREEDVSVIEPNEEILTEDIPLCLSIILKWNKICTSSNTDIYKNFKVFINILAR